MPDLDAATLTAICYALAVALCVLALTCAGLWSRCRFYQTAANDWAEKHARTGLALRELQGEVARSAFAASVNAVLADSARHFAEQVRAAEEPKPEADES